MVALKHKKAIAEEQCLLQIFKIVIIFFSSSTQASTDCRTFYPSPKEFDNLAEYISKLEEDPDSAIHKGY